MKKILFVLVAAALLLCGCGKGSRTGATLEVDLSLSYASELVSMNGISVTPIAVTEQGVIMERYNHGTEQMYLYDPLENTYREFEKSLKGAPSCVTQLPDGRLAAAYNIPVGRQGGMDKYDGKDRILEIYDSDLRPAETLHFGSDVPEEVLSPYNIIMDTDGYWYLFTHDENGFSSLCILNSDLTVKGTIELDSVSCEQLRVGKSGKVYSYSSALSDSSYSHVLYQFDAASMSGECLTDFEFPVDVRGIINGMGSELYYYTEDGIYSLLEDGTAQFLVDFANSDFSGDVWDCWALPNGEFVFSYVKASGNSLEYYRIRPRTEEENQNINVISLAGVNLSPNLIQDVCDYNKSQQEYRIVLKDYAALSGASDYETGYSEALEMFESDLLDGIVPDVICMDGISYRKFSSKGMLTDLSPMLENDERFDPALYHMNILDGLRDGEKLERIGFSFRIETLSAKTELVGEQQGRTPEEYVEMINNKPEDLGLMYWQSRETILNTFLCGSQSAFIDRSTMTSSFNSEGFVQFLKLAGSLERYEDLYAEDDPWINDESRDTMLLSWLSIEKPIQYHDEHACYRYEDMTLVGFPDAAGGNGGKYSMAYTLALTSRSDKVEPVWEFIMEQLSGIRQGKMCLDKMNYRENSLPIMRETLANCLRAATLGASRRYGNANEQEMAVLEDYVEGLRMYEEEDPFISNIIVEEAYMYFSGDQTAERAAEMVQKRVDLYLQE